MAGPELDDHIKIAVSNPAVNADRVLIVGFTTWRADKDQSCIIEIGQLPCLTNRSCVFYRGSKIISVAAYDAVCANGDINELCVAPAPVLALVRAGASQTLHLSSGGLQLLREQLLIPAAA